MHTIRHLKIHTQIILQMEVKLKKSGFPSKEAITKIENFTQPTSTHK